MGESDDENSVKSPTKRDESKDENAAKSPTNASGGEKSKMSSPKMNGDGTKQDSPKKDGDNDSVTSVTPTNRVQNGVDGIHTYCYICSSKNQPLPPGHLHHGIQLSQHPACICLEPQCQLMADQQLLQGQ